MSLFCMTGLVMKWLFRKPYTSRYPFEPRHALPGSRGSLGVVLTDCTYCTLCAKKCPTQAIEVDRAAKRWTIDRLRCITCSSCVEACPKGCLVLLTAHGKPTVTKDREVIERA
jgi:formate hydrogenlyase subunit 6/NADH:ubiquinone oxidoreductase subunit I